MGDLPKGTLGRAIAAMDFFKVEVLSVRGPVRYAVLVVMDLQSRRVQIAGIVQEPYEGWMLQVLRNLIDGVDGFLLPHHYLIMDRDPVFTQEFRARLACAGIEPIRLPRRSPNLNAFVERFNRSIKEECLDRVVHWARRISESSCASTWRTTTLNDRTRA